MTRNVELEHGRNQKFSRLGVESLTIPVESWDMVQDILWDFAQAIENLDCEVDIKELMQIFRRFDKWEIDMELGLPHIKP